MPQRTPCVPQLRPDATKETNTYASKRTRRALCRTAYKSLALTPQWVSYSVWLRVRAPESADQDLNPGAEAK